MTHVECARSHTDIYRRFQWFCFPSLVVLRLSCTSLTTTLEDVHQAITATPALKELHLQFYEPFEITHFLRQPQGSMLAGPLSKFVPGLMMLVFDGITGAVTDSSISDILTLLHSSWLNDDWTIISRTQLSVEFIFDELDLLIPVPSLVEDFNREIGSCGPLPFHASAYYVPDGLWDWRLKLTSGELRDCWDDFLAFRYR